MSEEVNKPEEGGQQPPLQKEGKPKTLKPWNILLALDKCEVFGGNPRVILDYLIRYGNWLPKDSPKPSFITYRSGPAIMRATGVTKNTVTACVDTLVEEEFVRKTQHDRGFAFTINVPMIMQRAREKQEERQRERIAQSSYSNRRTDGEPEPPEDLWSMSAESLQTPPVVEEPGDEPAEEPMTDEPVWMIDTSADQEDL